MGSAQFPPAPHLCGLHKSDPRTYFHSMDALRRAVGTDKTTALGANQLLVHSYLG